MRKFYETFLALVLCSIFVFGVTGFPSKTYAAEKVRFNADAKIQHIYEDHADLGTRSEDPTSDTTGDLRLKVTVQPTQSIKAFVEGRYLQAAGLSNSEDETGGTSATESFFELRQAWIRVNDLFYVPSLALQVGRQRIKEKRTIWWNRDFDAARVTYDSTLFRGFVGVGQNLTEYRTSNGDFEEEDKDRLRFFGEASWQLRPYEAVALRFLYENDHSGAESIGQLVKANDRDDEDAELLWIGGRLSGDWQRRVKRIENIHYRFDIMTVFGEETILTTSKGPSLAFRTVSSVRDRDVLGWALDAAFDVVLDIPANPVLTFGYAYASGDDNSADGTDNAFRQTGLQGNTSRFHEDSEGTMRNYGEVLRPELSNIHILTAAINVPVLDASDFSLIYHYYRLDEKGTGLGSTSISASLNGVDHDLGHGLDIVSYIHIGEEMNLSQRFLKKTSLKISLGAFMAGEAYGVADGEISYRSLSELRFRF